MNRLLPADLWQLHDCDQQATRLKLRALLKTNPDMDGHELAAQAVEYGRTRYRAALDAERRVRADREARSRAAKAALDEYRRSHGGSCFIGSGKPSGSVVVTGPGGRSM
ncbi:hypothetical protein BBIA_2398 [Bifidobacterium biavatii DSM 23969]|uniref:Uncharacterized protein n=1 Tax=Bifidobacterium biavatii DSM 23969 TaxID=1437608 RepID=A0A086ZD90_9BIFI|nr:hypothetical protein BBIA_2398 [Bifidobacterium biavatii DSM 23969]